MCCIKIECIIRCEISIIKHLKRNRVYFIKWRSSIENSNFWVNMVSHKWKVTIKNETSTSKLWLRLSRTTSIRGIGYSIMLKGNGRINDCICSWKTPTLRNSSHLWHLCRCWSIWTKGRWCPPLYQREKVWITSISGLLRMLLRSRLWCRMLLEAYLIKNYTKLKLTAFCI